MDAAKENLSPKVAMDYTNRSRAPMVAVASTDDFRAAAQQLVTSDDTVLEVGCADGITTDVLSHFANDVVGVDIAPGVIAKAKSRFPALDVRVLDAVSLCIFCIFLAWCVGA